MTIGMIIFMVSNIPSHLFITLFFHDFSLTWVPPALSSIELLFMGYAVICHRFYSWRYLVYRVGSTLFTIIVYTIPFLVLQAYGYTASHPWTIVIYCIVSGFTWYKTWHYISQSISRLLYGDRQAPAEKIYALVEDFQTSSQQAMQELAQLLQLKTGQPMLISPQQGDALYTSYLKQR
ncbi:hybrid sensor histidine kinase/response regulator, partial [Vibrio sp. PP-XX7]